MGRDRCSVTLSTLMGLLAFMAVLSIHTTVPFVMLPTLGQAVWSMGFAESFAKGPWYDIYARHFGLPEPAPIAFGLAGAWPASVLIRLGLHAADAYAAILAFWLAVALFGAYKLGRLLNVTPVVAWVGGVAWLSLPVVWAHADYSMLSLGIALLSFYYWTALSLFISEDGLKRHPVWHGLLYVLACIIAVFMDGYTFVMFAFGASLLWLYAVLCRQQTRKRLLMVALPIHIVGFALAYALYGLYIGKPSFNAHPLDFFRGWSLDLSYLLVPTTGVHGLFDWMGVGQSRSNLQHFGDSSVWRTTFGLPILVLGLIAAWRVWKLRVATRLGTAFLVIGLLSFYLALGPTLKFNTTKPAWLQESLPRGLSSSMPADAGIMPTGNAWVYSHLPAFNVMRATYRWSALGYFAVWLLIMLWLGQSRQSRSREFWSVAGLLFVIVASLPTLPDAWRDAMADRAMFKRIDADLVATLKRHFAAHETVAFVPWRNDFLINYLAPAADLRALNVGGDKNVTLASQSWTTEFRLLERAVDDKDAILALKLLADGAIDAVVVPYVDTLRSAHVWPCSATALQSGVSNESTDAERVAACTSTKKRQVEPFLDAVSRLTPLEIEETEWFAVIRLKATLDNTRSKAALSPFIADQFVYPMRPMGANQMHDLVLEEGWHAREPTHVWSTDLAHLMLPIPSECMARLRAGALPVTGGTKTECQAHLTLRAFGASKQRPVSIVITTGQSGSEERIEMTRTTPEPFVVSLPLFGRGSPWQAVTISVPGAISPRVLNGAADDRQLGVALSRIELIRAGHNP